VAFLAYYSCVIRNRDQGFFFGELGRGLLGTTLKPFLATVMGLLSLLVFFLGLVRASVFWLWIAFICALVSGVFIQLSIVRKKKNNAPDDLDK
jgi:hypothetical protein